MSIAKQKTDILLTTTLVSSTLPEVQVPVVLCANMDDMYAAQLTHLAPTRYRTIGSLIAIYESNFVRLLRLAPELERMEGIFVSRVAGALDLHLTVLERYKYTTLIGLTYRFFEPSHVDVDVDAQAAYVFEPDAKICIYHDARSAEIVSHCRRKATRKVHPWRRGHMPELDRKWELNRFLQKWLGFCLRQGHLFLSYTAETTTPSRRLETREPRAPWYESR